MRICAVWFGLASRYPRTDLEARGLKGRNGTVRYFNSQQVLRLSLTCEGIQGVK